MNENENMKLHKKTEYISMVYHFIKNNSESYLNAEISLKAIGGNKIGAPISVANSFRL